MSPGTATHELLDHTGDMAILVRAASFADLLDGAVRALFDVILDVTAVESREEVAVRVSGAQDREDLIVRLLSEALFLHDARGYVFAGFRAASVADDGVCGAALGERFDAQRHTIARQVKAVTYHHARVSEGPDGWSARLVLDL
jgi:SHS2 domain-containing protein